MRRKHKRLEMGGEGLMLAAMVDMMVNLLIFLLHLYGTDPASGSADSLELATATATEAIEGSTVLVVRTDAVVVNGQRVAELTAEDRDERLVDVLKAREAEARSKAQAKGEDFDGTIVLQVDRRIAWPELRSILRAAGQAGFWDLKFVVNSASEMPTQASALDAG